MTVRRLRVCVLVVLASYALASIRYVRVWQSDLTLWTAATERAPFAPRPHYNLAKAVLLAGHVDESIRLTEYGVRLEEVRAR